MRQNYVGQTSTYGGQLFYPATASFATAVTIPLFISQVDTPVRKPKITEVNTVPSQDEAGYSDWTVHAMFRGGQSALTTSIQGHFETPTRTTTDSYGQKYQQFDPTGDASLLGYSYGDLIWAYLQGRMNNTNSIFTRTDPTTYTDPFGNVYNNPVIQQFLCDYAPVPIKQTFSMTLYLEV